MSDALAIKYRPKDWDSVVEQESIKKILWNQLQTNTVKHAYLFCGPAGCGKTTCARIFANEINHNMGNPIELDAASNNSVDDARDLIQQSKTQSLDSEYKIFIIDECHALSNSAWQALLKIIEEPPTKSIFIFCTTDPQKIPATILSRVQRFDFQRISYQGLVDRLEHIHFIEVGAETPESYEAIQYIAKVADGGMRDAITMLDKCLSYSDILTMENVTHALDMAGYDVMFQLTYAVINSDINTVINTVDTMYDTGVDLKQFMKMYSEFIIDVCKYCINDTLKINIPMTDDNIKMLNRLSDYDILLSILSTVVTLNNEIKYSNSVRYDIQARFILLIGDKYEVQKKANSD